MFSRLEHMYFFISKVKNTPYTFAPADIESTLRGPKWEYGAFNKKNVLLNEDFSFYLIHTGSSDHKAQLDYVKLL